MSATRNLGIAAAKGDFIGFLDCDDVWEPAKLEQQLAVMEQYPCAGMIYGRTVIWHSWHEDAQHSDYYYPLGVPPDALYQPPGLLYVLLANSGQSPTTCNALMRSGVVREVGGFDNSFRGMFEDQVFFAKLMLVAPAYVDGRTWAKYRQHNRSFSARSARHHEDEPARLRFLRSFAAHAMRSRPGWLMVQVRIAREFARLYAQRSRRLLRAIRGGLA
ncbi:MAG: glycosyltransferase [Hyphomicrobiales bacterium]|nr:MAG: glycosyltransferase [Hyphomicrobiales bacterium]